MRPTQAGRKRQRVELFDVPETTRDSYAQPSQVPTSLGTFWAEVRSLKGGEMLNVRAMWATATDTVKLRWLGSAIPTSQTNPNGYILPRMKFVLEKDGRVLNVLWAGNTEERNREWVCYCEEKSEATS